MLLILFTIKPFILITFIIILRKSAPRRLRFQRSRENMPIVTHSIFLDNLIIQIYSIIISRIAKTSKPLYT